MSSSSAFDPHALQKDISYILACKHQKLACNLFTRTPKWQIRKRERRYELWQRNAVKAHQMEVHYILSGERALYELAEQASIDS